MTYRVQQVKVKRRKGLDLGRIRRMFDAAHRELARMTDLRNKIPVYDAAIEQHKRRVAAIRGGG